MDRTKGPSKRGGGRGKGHPPPGDFIALGNKARPSIPDTEPRPIGSFQKKPSFSTGSSSSLDRKRDLPLGSSLAKKPRLASQTLTPLGRPLDTDRRSSPAPTSIPHYEEIAIDIDNNDLFEAIESAELDGDDNRLEGLLCGAIKSLKTNRAKPDQALYLTLMCLAKSKAQLFDSDVVIDAMCSCLKRDIGMAFKVKGNALVSVLICNMLMAAFQEEENWPDQFLKVYVEDSIGERIWVDREDCKGFVENIQSVFNTKVPPKYLLDTLKIGDATSCPSPVQGLFDDDDSRDGSDIMSQKVLTLGASDEYNITVFPRYMYQQDGVENYIIETVKEPLTRRQGMEGITKNLLKLICSACGYQEIRSMTAHRLEMWLQNPKLTRQAQELLLSVCMNCSTHSQADISLITDLIKIRLKTKGLINHYLTCIRELITQHPDNLRTVMTHTIYNELSSARNPNNMGILSVIFQTAPEDSAKILAEIFQDFLMNREDYVRTLRALLREIVRTLKYDMNFQAFCLGLTKERTDTKFTTELDQQIKERMFHGIADLVTLAGLLSITPQVREAVAAYDRGELKDLRYLKDYQLQMATIQRDAVWWMHDIVPKMWKIKPAEYGQVLHKLLFLEKPEAYHAKDNWPPDAERNLMLRLASDVPVLEDTLMRILIIGLASESLLNAADAIELADQLVRRAAALHQEGFLVLKVEKVELVEAVLHLCTYHHPDNISLPKGYTPPSLAVSSRYWKAWSMLLIIAAFNPSVFGRLSWEEYPTLKCLMEMAMTNNFKFPPPTTATDEKVIEEIRNRDKQITQLEKQQILEFEGYLAAATYKVTITEANSLLLSQLTTMDPNGPARRPSGQVLDQLRTLNKTLKIGHMLCRSRSPDFLMDVIQRQGNLQSMPWLAELVESSEGALDVLPVQCLCEFLLHDAPDAASNSDEEDEQAAQKVKKKQKLRKQEQLLFHLHQLLFSESSDLEGTREVIEYFLRRLSNQQTSSRTMAVKGLSLVLRKPGSIHAYEMDVEYKSSSMVISSHSWLLDRMPRLTHFPSIFPSITQALRQACLIETDVHAVSAYIVFMAENLNTEQMQDMADLCLDLSQLIVDRTLVMNHILSFEQSPNNCSQLVLSSLISIFYRYLKKAKEPQKDGYSWSDTQDQILLQWENGDTATLHILVVHAMIVILTYGKPEEIQSDFDDLLEIWFPIHGSPPSAFLVDTSEEALLLPDWLKLRLIRSHVGRLVDASLADLDPSQLLLFVQSFGIPVKSMSKLLTALDNATQDQNSRYMLEKNSMEKTYMAQLVEAQWMRGATGGKIFYSLLKEGDEKPKEEPDVEMKPETSKATPPRSILMPRPELPNFQSGAQVFQYMKQIFLTDVPIKDKVKFVKMLQQSMVRNRQLPTMIRDSLIQIMASTDKNIIMTQLLGLTSAGCSFLRLLVAKLPNDEKLGSFMNVIYNMTPEGSPLRIIAQQYLAKLSKQNNPVAQTHDAIKSGGKVDENLFYSVIQKMDQAKSPHLEELVNKCMQECLVDKSTNPRTRTTSTYLHNQYQSEIPSSAVGLFLDWLELLDPEVIQHCPELQQTLLFARQNVTDRKVSNQSYLLAVLTHQSNWNTLYNCIKVLLKEDMNIEKYNSTAILDFLSACLHIPKIWHGRDKKLPKHYVPEDIFNLTPQQTCVLTEHIIQEAKLADKPAESIGTRAPFLVKCCCENEERINVLVQHVLQKIHCNRQNSKEYRQLLVEIYVQYPTSLNWRECAGEFLRDVTVHSPVCPLDKITHNLLTAMAESQPGTKGGEKMASANVACRKIALEHPTLLLRQLPMLAALLKGRTNFAYPEFFHRHSPELFSYALGILELLMPAIFGKEHTSLDDIIGVYFDLIQSYGFKSEIIATMNRFIYFLHNFLSNDSVRATKALQKYMDTLNNMAHRMADFSTLKSLIAGLSLVHQEGQETTDDSKETGSTAVGTRPSSPWTVSQLAPYTHRMSKDASTDEIYEVLRDLDRVSERKVEVLEHFISDLKRLLSHSVDEIRRRSYHLLIKYMKHQPSCGRQVVSAYIQCLEHSNQAIRGTALSHLSEITLLCREDASSILQKAFAVSIDSNSFMSYDSSNMTDVEVTSYINKAIRDSSWNWWYRVRTMPSKDDENS